MDGKIIVGEWLSYAANEVPQLLENGAVKTARGLVPIGEPVPSVKSG